MKKALVTTLLLVGLLNQGGYSQGPILLQSQALHGLASWYSETDPGILKTTANMEIFDDQQLTCAIWDMPFNTLIKVTNVSNGKFVVVRVNDRGPARRLVRQGRVIDLSKAAFAQIADLNKGLINIELAVISAE